MSKRTKIWTVLAIACILIGSIIFVGVMTIMEWDFRKLSTEKYETNTYEIAEAFENISVDGIRTKITFVPTNAAKTQVVCYEKKNVKHTVAVEDGTLTIRCTDSRRWYQYIGIHLDTPTVTVTLPEGEYGKLMVHNTTGDVKVPRGLTFSQMDISVTTGDLWLEASAVGDITCKATTGDVHLTGVRCQNLTTAGSTGDLTMQDVITAGKCTVSYTTGDVELQNCDAAELYIKVTTGDVEGNLLTPKNFQCKATTGDVEVPRSSEGGLCQVKTTTGDIELTVGPKTEK